MKISFIVVSLVAILYLSLQTSWVKTWINHFELNGQTQEQTLDMQVQPKENALSQQNTALTAKIEFLQAQIDKLETKLEKVTTQQKASAIAPITEQNTSFLTATESPSSDKLSHQFGLNNNSFDQQNELPKLSEQESSGFTNLNESAKTKALSENKRRLNQQAVLRELSEKMELVALQNLSK